MLKGARATPLSFLTRARCSSKPDVVDVAERQWAKLSRVRIAGGCTGGRVTACSTAVAIEPSGWTISSSTSQNSPSPNNPSQAGRETCFGGFSVWGKKSSPIKTIAGIGDDFLEV